MKRFLATTAIILCAACTYDIPGDEMGEAVFSLSAPTKISGTPAEASVSNWAVMLFDASNPEAKYFAQANDGSDITCYARKGRPYRVYAIANYPTEGAGRFSPEDVESEDWLLSFTARLSGNSPGHLTMFGSAWIESLPEKGTNRIWLNRLCSKISIRKIRLQTDDEAYTGSTLSIGAIYLTNVYLRSGLADSDFDASEDPSDWYNAMGWHLSGAENALDALVGDRGIGKELENGQSYENAHVFYAFPNPVTEDCQDAEWSPRCTRMVIEATLGGKRYYYAISFPGMQRNHSYIVTEAVIKSPGSLSPEEVIPGSIAASITTVQDTWDTEYTTSEDS